MRDPFVDLRADDAPVAPDPAFTAALRARLERALALPEGVIPVTTATDTAPQDAATQPHSAAIPYLAVRGARRAMDWYRDIFGAELAGEPIVMPDGRIGHAELMVAGGVIYLSDEHPEIGVTAPRPGEAAVSLMLPVHDADRVRAVAMAAGASGDREPYDGYGSRNAWIVDPFGHRWGLHSPLAGGTVGYRHGDVGYVSLWVPDVSRAATFYREVLGWDVAVTPEAGGALVRGATPSTGMATGEPPTLFCCYAVDDLDAAISRVHEAGGTAAAIVDRPEGRTADCTDDQGARFALYEQLAGETGARPSATGRREGDLSYITLEVADSSRARAFYGAVLGWRFSPGTIADGWQVEDTVPMIGMSGGHERPAGVPMWRVADIDRAVAAVRAAGGEASEPSRQPYGITSQCRDDQGVPFFLGQL
jgi:predicted enzyme related to lactoylglutathione lyase